MSNKNSKVFPPRGSFINIPEEVLSGCNAKSLDNVIKDKSDNICSDLYKEIKNKK